MSDTLTEGAVELPTTRISRHLETPDLDVHDPNYIPLLNRDAGAKVGFSTPAIYGLPSLPTLRKHDVQSSLQRSNSSSAPETVMQFRPTHNLPSRQPTDSKQGIPHEIGSSQTQGKKEELYAGSPSLSVSEPSVVCTTSSLEEHVFTIPGNIAPRSEELQYPAVPQSARSSMSSASRKTVPTSRYNKHSMSSLASPGLGGLPSRPTTLLPSQAEGLEPVVPRKSHEVPLSAPPIPQPSPKLLPMKSTASERRARALHSHPSNMSIKLKSSPRVSDVEERPHRVDMDSRSLTSRPKSSRSIVNSRQPSPAPTAPLPDLPPQARRGRQAERSTERRQERAVTPTTLPPARSTTTLSQYADMSESMTHKKSTLFRRFDDVHVRLLHHLQEEIATLEKQLLDLENDDLGLRDTASEKVRLLQELRKAVAEYDNLFATWNAMQANKASDVTTEELNHWRHNSAYAGSITQSAKDDLSWLQPSKNMSTVSVDLEKQSSVTHLAGTNTRRASTSSKAGGFLAWFGCASKRK